MARSLLTIEASATYSATAPTLEVLVNGVVYSSASVAAITGVGTDLLSFQIEYPGDFPTSLSFRFNDGSAEGGRTLTVENVRINGQLIDRSADMTSNVALNQNDSVGIIVANTQHLYGRTAIAESDLGTVTHNGTGADDDLRGTGSGDVLDGGGGNDRIAGLQRDDAISGDLGNDYLFGGQGNDIIIGGAGNDVLTGDDGDDILHGQGDNDFVLGGAGNDLLNGGAGDDVLAGDEGDDIMYGEDGADRLIGDDGNDVMYGDAGNDLMHGGAGNDYMDGGDGNDNMIGGDGINEIYGGLGNDNIIGGADVDTIDGGAGTDVIFARGGNDIVSGGADADNIFGGGGNDTLNGDGGNDLIAGGAGADTIDGGAGNDIIHGHNLDYTEISTILRNNPNVVYSYQTGSFYELVNAGSNITWTDAQTAAAANTINGVAGHLAVITTQTEHAELVANVYTGDNAFVGGSDTAAEGTWEWEFGPEAGLQFWDEGSGTALNNAYTNWTTGQPNDSDGGQDYLYILNNNDQWADAYINGGGGFVNILHYVVEWEGGLFSDDSAADIMSGGAGSDWLYGWGGNDTLNGDAGNDFLFGGDGNDTMDGGANDDYIVGAAGTDNIQGSGGNDVIYAAVVGAVGSQNVTASLGSGVILTANFSTDLDGFAYADGVFGSSGSSNAYASGARITSDGDNTGSGAVEVALGGLDNNTISTMSGAFQQTFNLAADVSNVTLSFSYRVLDGVLDADPFDAGEDTQLYADIDGTTYSNDANPYFFEILGTDAGDAYDSGWQTVALNVGALTAGNHTLSLGGLLTDKTWTSEQMLVRFDDIALYEPAIATLISEDFTAGTGVFSYSDGFPLIGGSDPANADVQGIHDTADGAAAAGSMKVDIDGFNNNAFSNASGNWSTTVTPADDIENVQLTFSYRHFQANQNDNNEDSQVWITFDGNIYDATGGSSFLSEHQGAGGGGPNDDTGWVTVTIDLPDLTAGNSYNLAMGIIHLGSNRNNEDAYVSFDDITLAGDVATGNDAISSGNDSAQTHNIDGGDGNDVIYGSAGTDVLNGGAGSDTIYSDSQAGGNSTEINGGSGADNLYGSGGADLFIFDSNGGDAFTNPDTVYNFDRFDGDVLDISDIVSGLGVNATNISDFVEITEGNGLRVDTSGSGSFGAGTTVANFTGISAVWDETVMLSDGNLLI